MNGIKTPCQRSILASLSTSNAMSGTDASFCSEPSLFCILSRTVVRWKCSKLCFISAGGGAPSSYSGLWRARVGSCGHSLCGDGCARGSHLRPLAARFAEVRAEVVVGIQFAQSGTHVDFFLLEPRVDAIHVHSERGSLSTPHETISSHQEISTHIGLGHKKGLS